MAFEIPRLETERLLLREWQEKDLDPYAKFTADAEMMRYLGGETLDRAGTWRQIATFVGHWHLRRCGLWVVEEKATGAFAGRVGILNPEGWPGVEVGWSITPEFHGKGFATEAGLASAHWAFDNIESDSLISIIHPENEASKAVGTRIGERFDHMEAVKGIECCIYKVERGGLIG